MNNDLTKCGAWYKKYFGRIIPSFGVISLISCFLVNSLIYSGTQFLMADAKHYDFTTWLDNRIPFVKWWIIIYVVCFGFWAVNYVLIVREGREKWFRFATADMLSRVICGIFFVIMPTTNCRPEVTGTGFTTMLVQFIYKMDAPTNLFPSIHCLVSWFCFVGIRKSHKIPFWYKAFSCVFALMICASTQFTKQHYLIDLVAGIAIAELCYALTTHTNIYRKVEGFFDRITAFVFGKEGLN